MAHYTQAHLKARKRDLANARSGVEKLRQANRGLSDADAALNNQIIGELEERIRKLEAEVQTIEAALRRT